MHLPRKTAAFIVLVALLGCAGGTTSAPSSPSTPIPDLSGNWGADVITNNIPPAGPIVDFQGALQFNAGAITGTFRATANTPNMCVSLVQDLAVTGSLDASGNLVLTMPISGGTATITAPITNAQGQNHGTWQIVGGTCATASTPMNISQFAPATGTYTGTATSNSITSPLVSITAVLTQSTVPNADGQFPLTGTVTVTGSCPASYPIVGGVVSGPVVEAYSNPATTTTILTGDINPAATTMSASWFCQNVGYLGILTRQ